MYNFTVSMGLMDYVPVAFFAVSALVLLGCLYGKLSKAGYVLLAAGSVNVFLAGFCKATWKLLYAANVCNFVALEEMFLPVNSMGLLMVGIAMLLPRKKAMLSAAPVVFSGSLPFIAMMVLGLGGMCAGLSGIAVKLKQKKAIVWFVLSFVFAMGMGYMSSQDSSQAWVNWVEQGINTVSQACLMIGVLALRKAGLKEAQL